MTQTAADSNRWHFHELGEGAAGKTNLVLVHGFPMDHRLWAACAAEITPKGRIIAPDLPGFGNSPAHAFTVESAARELRDQLREIGALPCVLGGLSMGGYISLAFARQFPQDLAGLILCDTRAAADTEAVRESRGATIEMVRQRGSAALLEQMAPKLLSPANQQNRAMVEEQLEAMALPISKEGLIGAISGVRDRPDQTSVLATLRVPTLFLGGQEDALTPPALMHEMYDAVVRGGNTFCWHETIAGAGHLAPMEQPTLVAGAISRFLVHVVNG